MDVSVALVAITAGAAIVPVALVLAVRRPVQARLFRDTGLTEWRQSARRVSLRDRRCLYRTTTRGEAAPPRLIGLAVQRAETMLAVHERMTDRSHPLRRVWLGLGVVFLVLAAVSLVSLALAPGDRSTPVNLALESALGLMFLLQPRLLRRQQRRLQRSLELNRAATVS